MTKLDRGLLLFVLASVFACGTDVTTPQECNPLGGASCITPWPSALYERDDGSTFTGVRLDIPTGALPTNLDNIPIDPAPFNERDGFSPVAPILVAFPGGVDAAQLVPYTNYPASVTADSPTVLLNMNTGDLVEHFAEVDVRAEGGATSASVEPKPRRRPHCAC